MKDTTEKTGKQEIGKQTKEDLESILNTIREGICVIDKDFRIKSFNRAFVVNLDFPRDKIVGEKCYRVLHGYSDEDFKKFCVDKCIVKEAFETGKSVESIHEHVQKDGSVVYHECRALLSKGRDGEEQVVYIINDITKGKRAEEKIKREKEFSERLIEIANALIVGLDKGGNITLFNKKLEEVSGYSKEEILEKNWFDIFVPERYKTVVHRAFKTTVEGKLPSRYLNPIITKDGEERTISWSNTYLENEKGEIIGALGIGEDITERIKLEQELNERVEELEHSTRLKDLFTDIMSHDLLGPVGVIRGISEILLDDESLAKIGEELEMITENARKLQEMIERASAYAKLESLDRLEFEKNDLSKIVDSTIKGLQGLAKEKGIEIESDLKGEYLALVNPFIEDAFSNLISNAIKYSPEESRVVVDIEDGGEDWKVAVKDFGGGISDRDKGDIFLRFKRVKKKGVKGTGLGLAIAKRIVELHKGEIWVEDNPEGGSIFYFTLPKEEG